MESGIIPDINIVATSSKSGYEAGKGRLNRPSCWMPVSNRGTETITVNFKHGVKIIAIATQGAPKRWLLGEKLLYQIWFSKCQRIITQGKSKLLFASKTSFFFRSNVIC